jgi:hypothetical protein
MTIHLERLSPGASCNQPGRQTGNSPEAEASRHPYSVLLLVGFTVPLPLPVARCALTAPFHPGHAVPEDKAGGLFSVALSLGLPPPGITRHRISAEPGLSSIATLSGLGNSGHPADWQAGCRVQSGAGQEICLNLARSGPSICGMKDQGKMSKTLDAAINPQTGTFEVLTAGADTSPKPIDRAATLRKLKWIARGMDSAVKIPFTNIRFGADSMIGLIPGVGDVVTLGVSAYTLLLARRVGAPPQLIAKMVANIAVDTSLGAVPVLGDVFDLFFKSNTRNLTLLMQHLEDDAKS